MEETMVKEIVLAGLTITVTKLTGDIITDLLVGILTYTVARLFYWAFEKKIKNSLIKLKSSLVKLKQRFKTLKK